MTQQQQYSPGDVVNGHVMTSNGEWLPVGAQPTPEAPTVAHSSTSEAFQPFEGVAGRRTAKKTLRRIIAGVGIAVLVLVAVIIGVAIATAGDGGSSTAAGTAEEGSGGETAAAEKAVEEPGQTVDLASFTPVDATTWAQIAKDPDAASGEKVVVFAEVTQFDTATGTESFRANTGARQPAAEFELETNAIFGGNGDSLADVTQGDVLRVFAEVSGSLEYETAIGGSTVVPSLEVVSVEEVGYLDITGDAVLGTPSWGEYGGVDVPVTVTNSSDEAMTYSVDVVAESPDGALQLGTASAYVDNLAPGQSAPTEANFFEDLPADVVIKVVNVDRYSD